MNGDGILVGYDGSLGSERALVWAAGEAGLRAAGLTVCHAWTPWYPPWPADGIMAAGLARAGGEQILAQGVRLARSLLGDGQVRPLLAPGSAADILCRLASGADMVVVGPARHRGFAGLLLGSVSSQVAAHAPGPAIVVPSTWEPALARRSLPVAVGVSGSVSSETAVAFAFAEAALHAVPVLAVCGLAGAAGGAEGARQLQDAFDCLLDRWEKEHPEVLLWRRVSADTPGAALLAAACEAQLLVVGSAGGGQHRLHDPAGRALLEHAPCPVSVAHPRCHPVTVGRASARPYTAPAVRWALSDGGVR